MIVSGAAVIAGAVAIGTNIAAQNAKILNAQKNKTTSNNSIGRFSSFDPGFYSDTHGASVNEDILFTHGDGAIGNLDWVSFDRFYTVDLNKEGPSGRHYIFFCRQDLNLVDP